MTSLISLLFVALVFGCKNNDSPNDRSVKHPDTEQSNPILCGDDQIEEYLPLLKGKLVSLVVNQTSTIGHTHLVDTLLSLGVQIDKILAPEHGFRGTEDAGATVFNAKDTQTGLPVISLYGDKKKPSREDLADAEIVVFDIQDVGARFYTYISTLHYLMEACAEYHKPLLILDRPNPNGFYVDGPVLKQEFSSFVGMHPVPIVHGMTVGEYAQMINGEYWLADSIQCDLQVIRCKNYSHADYYSLPVSPSPNLRSMKAIYLYPSLCLFEGTNVSVGRGTPHPFEMFGSPMMRPEEIKGCPCRTIDFIPQSGPGSKNPPFMNQVCHGYDYSSADEKVLRDSVVGHRLNLHFVIDAYRDFSDKNQFFGPNNYFNKLAGTDELMLQIQSGLSAEEIALSWQDDIAEFKIIRKKYLLYVDFE